MISKVWNSRFNEKFRHTSSTLLIDDDEDYDYLLKKQIVQIE